MSSNSYIMPTDLINSSESLELFIRHENLESPLVRSELDSGKRYDQAIDAIALEMKKGSRTLVFDIPSVPVDGYPGRRVAVQLYAEIVNRVNELQGAALSDLSWYDLRRELDQSSVTPFYPKEPSLLMAYYAHVEHWGCQIESNDESVYSNTIGKVGEGVSIGNIAGDFLYLLTTSYFKRSPYGDYDMIRLIESANESLDNRITIAKHLYTSYRNLVEHTPDFILYRGRVRTSRKRCVISLIDEMAAGGSNPFDVLR
jgi:hypothetical protein